MVLFSIYDEDLLSADDFIGQYSIAFNNIQEGFRCLPIKNSKGTPYEKASLLVQFKITDETEVKTTVTTSTTSTATSSSTSNVSVSSDVNPKEKYEGYLIKKGKVRTNWKKRWFVLQTGVMRYYKAPNSVC